MTPKTTTTTKTVGWTVVLTMAQHQSEKHAANLVVRRIAHRLDGHKLNMTLQVPDMQTCR